MSGSGSGGWQPTVPSNPCERIAFRADLNSPQPAVIATLKLGDVLNIRLQTTPVNAVVAEISGAVAGAITGTQVNALVNCLQNGYKYICTVVAITGGVCTVHVKSE